MWPRSTTAARSSCFRPLAGGFVGDNVIKGLGAALDQLPYFQSYKPELRCRPGRDRGGRLGSPARMRRAPPRVDAGIGHPGFCFA